jgi:uncharacterized BrkB/YihY/UPF0761 family membrane protein
MKPFTIRFVIMTAILFVGGFLYSQSIIPGDPFKGTNEEIAQNLVQWHNFAMLGLSYLLVYLSRFIPVLKRVDNLAWRAAIVGIIAAVSFWKLGAGALGIFISFLTFINPYEMLLKPVIGATKPEALPQQPEPNEEMPDDSSEEEI